MHRPLLLTILLAGLPADAPAQPAGSVAHAFRPLAGKVFLSWGYNRSIFSRSDLHLSGPGYDFVLHDVRADDRPEPFSLKNYFAPANIWIPQYNYRVGWFMNEHWSLSLGLDHMKYVMRQDQTVRITGRIDPERSVEHASDTEHDVVLTPEFLRFEHTDGLNLLSVDAHHYDLLWRSADGRCALRLMEGLFVGPVIPRTDVRLFGDGINNRFHVAGYGVGGELGAMLELPARILVRGGARGGFIGLPDILTTGTAEDRASQHFLFLQGYMALGVLIGR